jgi:hypothetical protein
VVALNGHVMNGHSEHGEVYDEQAQLEAGIAAAKARAAAARDRGARRDADIRAALKIEVELSQARLAEMERQHQIAITMLREAASTEVERILSEARQQIDAMDVAIDRPGVDDEH